jgi:hypothetical protein
LTLEAAHVSVVNAAARSASLVADAGLLLMVMPVVAGFVRRTAIRTRTFGYRP